MTESPRAVYLSLQEAPVVSQEMTDCPVCKNEVPKLAPRCKHCFSDLTEHWTGGRKTGNPLIPVIILGLLFVAAGSWLLSV